MDDVAPEKRKPLEKGRPSVRLLCSSSFPPGVAVEASLHRGCGGGDRSRVRREDSDGRGLPGARTLLGAPGLTRNKKILETRIRINFSLYLSLL